VGRAHRPRLHHAHDDLPGGRRRPAGVAAGRRPDDDPDAGGWGRVIATVPFTLTGRELRFEAPLAALGDDDGYFAYRLFTTEYGLTVDELESRLLPPGEDPDPDPTPIPLPPALPTAALTTLLLMVRWCRHAGGSPT
jgi:hypothetical protein